MHTLSLTAASLVPLFFESCTMYPRRQWGVGFRLNFQSPKKKNRTNAEIDPHRPQKQNPYRRSRMQILVKRTFGLILAAACACAAAHAQSVTQADRDKALAYLE